MSPFLYIDIIVYGVRFYVFKQTQILAMGMTSLNAEVSVAIGMNSCIEGCEVGFHSNGDENELSSSEAA